MSISLSTLALISLIASGAGVAAKGWGSLGGRNVDFDPSSLNTSQLDPDTVALWNSLSGSDKSAIAQQFYKEDNNWENLWGITGDERYSVDTNALLDALGSSPQMLNEYNALGSAPVLSDYLAGARDEADKLYSGMRQDIADLDAKRLATHQDEMRNIATGYNQLRSNLLTSQYQQNAQLMDSVQSGMERSRRNALEAGASAGIRIADNINTLLSVQNKQSATAMETANQLSQMMINQRNAEAESRRSYDDYVTQSTANKHNLTREQEGYAQNLANTNFQSAQQSYAAKEQELDSKYGTSNPLYDFRGLLKSKYSKGGV